MVAIFKKTAHGYMGFIYQYQYFTLITMTFQILDLEKTDSQLKLLTAMPLFLMPYAYAFIPFILVMGLFTVDKDIYWNMAHFYCIVIVSILLVLITTRIFSNDRIKNICYKIECQIIKHHYFVVIFAIVHSIFRLIEKDSEYPEITLLGLSLLYIILS